MGISGNLNSSDNVRNWTQEEDNQVRLAIIYYNHDHRDSPFPEDPFQGKLKFSLLKDNYLISLDKTPKQIRQRWNDHLCRKLRHSSVLEEDKQLVQRLCDANPGNWVEVARKVYEVFGGQYYYSDNAIKNFYHQATKKRLKEESLATEALEQESPSSKRVKQGETTNTMTPPRIGSSLVITEAEEIALIESIANEATESFLKENPSFFIPRPAAELP